LTKPAYVARVKSDSETSGVLLLRTWLHDGQLVARLQTSRDGDPDQQSQVAVGIEAIEETVQRWLRDFTETPR
jgi:hypothetical protein